MSAASHYSKDYFEFVRNVGECKSKQEEDGIILVERDDLKTRVNQKDTTGKKMRECLLRLIYCEMLGHESEFGYIHAVNAAQESGLLEKRVGYLASMLFLHEEHELNVLLVNTIQKDLKSSNNMEVCAALDAATRLIGEETVPAILKQVTDLLGSNEELIRRKAVQTIHSIVKRAPTYLTDMDDKFRRALCDAAPSVMAASLCLFHDLVKANPARYKNLVPSFVSILKQVIDHRLPREYDYHRSPAPWIQCRIFQILSILGRDDQRRSEEMYEVLLEAMKRGDTGTNIGHAVVFECIRTITSIYASAQLIENAASCISRFITSDSYNLKYIGIKALTLIVVVNPKYAMPHQLVVIDCLEDTDESLRRKTLDLLYRMTSPYNVEVVVEKMLGQLRIALDVHLRKELVSRITELAERFAPNNSWFIQTMNTVFEIGGEFVPPKVAHNLMRLIAEGTDDAATDEELRTYAVASYVELLFKEREADAREMDDLLVQTIAWVVGEYSYLSEDYSPTDILTRLCEFVQRPATASYTRCMLVTAMMKIVAQQQSFPPVVMDCVRKFVASQDPELRQRCCELEVLLQNLSYLNDVMPADASCEDVEVEPDMPFLRVYVQNALQRGLPAWVPPHQRKGRSAGAVDSGGRAAKPVGGAKLNFEAYSLPTQQAPSMPTNLPQQSSGLAAGGDMSAASAAAAAAGGGSAHAGDDGQGSSIGLAGLKKKFGKKAEPAAAGGMFAPSASSGSGGGFGAPAAAGAATASSASAPAAAGSAGERKLGGLAAQQQASAAEEQKAKMAAALFGGVPSAQGAGGASGAAAAGGRKPFARKDQPAATAAPPANGGGSLLSPQPAASASSARASPGGASSSSGLDMFGSLSLGPSSAGAASASPQPAAGRGAPAAKPSNDLVDLLSGFDTVPSASAAGRASATKKPEDVFSLLTPASSSSPSLSGDVLMPSQPAHFGQSASDRFGFPKAWLATLGSAPKSSSMWEGVASDDVLKISQVNVYLPEGLCTVLQIFNTASLGTRAVQLQLEVPQLLRFTITTEPSAQVSSGRVEFATIGARVSVFIMINVALLDNVHTINVTGRCSYQMSSGNVQDRQFFAFAMPYRLLDFLRPCALSTADYGQKWGMHSSQGSFKVSPCSFKTPEALASFLESKCALKLVQVIRQEAIFSAKMLNGNFVLVHCKLSLNTVEIMLRTKAKPLTDAVQRLLQEALA